jgi:hypothetical protein
MHRNDQALLVALALAVASALLVWATIVAGAFAMPNDAGWIYNYQSLIGGIIALSGAAVGAWFLHKQIRQTTEIENGDVSGSALRCAPLDQSFYPV